MDPLLPIPEYYEAELRQAQLKADLADLAVRLSGRAHRVTDGGVTAQELDELETEAFVAHLEVDKAQAVLAFVRKYSPAALRVLERQ